MRRPWILCLPLIAALGCGDDPVPGSADAPAPADAGSRDRPSPDGGDPDSGSADLGLADAEIGPEAGPPPDLGAPDAGIEGGRLEVFPEPVTFPGGEGSVAEVAVRNLGPGSARVARAALRVADDGADSADFVLEACGGARCALDVQLCDPAAPSCGAGAATALRVRYANPDGSARDDAILRVVPGTGPAVDVPVIASRAPCASPTPRLALERPAEELAPGAPAVVDGTTSDPGGDERSLVYFFWTVVAHPGASAPPLSGQGMPLVSLTPTSTGAYALTLSVTNDCGQTSPTPARLDFTLN